MVDFLVAPLYRLSMWRRKRQPDAVSDWLDEQPRSVRDAINAVCKPLAGADAGKVLGALREARVSVPDHVMRYLAVRVSAVPAWASLPAGSRFMDEETGRRWRIGATSKVRYQTPPDPVDDWLGSLSDDAHEAIAAVREKYVGRDVMDVLAGLRAAGIEGPDHAMAGLAARISATKWWMLAPNGTEWTDEKGRKHRITNRAEFRVKATFRTIQEG